MRSGKANKIEQRIQKHLDLMDLPASVFIDASDPSNVYCVINMKVYDPSIKGIKSYETVFSFDMEETLAPDFIKNFLYDDILPAINKKIESEDFYEYKGATEYENVMAVERNKKRVRRSRAKARAARLAAKSSTCEENPCEENPLAEWEKELISATSAPTPAPE